MEIITSIMDLRSALYEAKRLKSLGSSGTVGLVPTLGYMHRGHESLLASSRQRCDLTVLSIFVNPLQFGPNEDFERYPRDTERDLRIAEAAGVDFVFLPSTAEMFPQPLRTKVTVSEVTSRLCGASRPGHFDGVSTIVMKLLHIVQPDFAFFGLKDAQQAAVIEQMVADMNMNITIVPCPTVRESDGLALSSRNVFLNEEERRQAVIIHQTLYKDMSLWLSDPTITVEELRTRIENNILTKPLASIEYAEVLWYPSLNPISQGTTVLEIVQQYRGYKLIAAAAVKFGATRLIDNRLISVEELTSCSER